MLCIKRILQTHRSGKINWKESKEIKMMGMCWRKGKESMRIKDLL